MPILCEENQRSGLRAPDHPITRSFAMWGPGLLGSFMKVLGGLTHLLVVVNKFTKWIETIPLAKIGSMQAVNFAQDNVFSFRFPNSIITDNGTQFTREKSLDFYVDNNIWVDSATVTHPCTNGQVERANGLIPHGLKPHILTQEGKDVHT
jgi:IS30 family transposase